MVGETGTAPVSARAAPPLHELQGWEDFDVALRNKIGETKHAGLVLVRNFARASFDLDEDGCPLGGEVDRLRIAIETGTDRDDGSPFWNVPGHDYEHDQHPCGMEASKIVYAYVVDATTTPLSVHITDDPEQFDLTAGLTEHDGILVYDAEMLRRVSKNEHWFLGDPRDALLMIFVPRGDGASNEDA